MENTTVQLPGLSLVRWTSSRLKEILPKLQALLKVGKDATEVDHVEELVSKCIAIMLSTETESQEVVLREALELLSADNVLVLLKSLVLTMQHPTAAYSAEKSSKKRKQSQVDSDEQLLHVSTLRKMSVVVKCMLVSGGEQLRASAVAVGSNFNEPALKELCLATCSALSHLIKEVHEQHDVHALVPLVTNLLLFFQSSLVFFSSARKVFAILTEHFLQPALQLLSLAANADLSPIVKAIKSIFQEVYFIEKHVVELASVNYQQLVTGAAQKPVQKKKEDGKGNKGNAGSFVEKFFEAVVQFFQSPSDAISVEERGRGVAELWKVYAQCSKLSCLVEDNSVDAKDNQVEDAQQEDGKGKKGSSSSSRHSHAKDEVLSLRKHLIRIMHLTFAFVQYLESSQSQASTSVVKSKAFLFSALYEWMETDRLSIPNHNSMDKYVAALRAAWKHAHDHVQLLQRQLDHFTISEENCEVLQVLSFEYDSMRVLQLIDHRIAVDHLHEIGSTLCPSRNVLDLNTDTERVLAKLLYASNTTMQSTEFERHLSLFRTALQHLFVDLWKLFVKLRSIDLLLNALLRASNGQTDCQSHWRKQLLYTIIQQDPSIRELILSSFIAIPSGQWTKMWSILLHQAASSSSATTVKKTVEKDVGTIEEDEEERSAKMLVESNGEQDVSTMNAEQKNHARASLCVLRSTFYALAFSAQLHISKSTVIVHQSSLTTVIVDEHSQHLLAFLYHVVQSWNCSGDALLASRGLGESVSIFSAHAALLSALVSYLVKAYSSAESIRLLLTEVLLDEDEDTRRSCVDILSVDCMALMLDLVSAKHQKLLQSLPTGTLSLLQVEMAFLHLMLNLRAKTSSHGPHASAIQRCIDELRTTFFSLIAVVAQQASATACLNVLHLLLRQFNIWAVLLPHRYEEVGNDPKSSKNLKTLQSFLQQAVSVYFDAVLSVDKAAAHQPQNMVTIAGIATALASISCADHAVMAMFVFEAVLSTLQTLQNTTSNADHVRVSRWISATVKVLPKNYFHTQHSDTKWMAMKHSMAKLLIHFISSTKWQTILDIGEEDRMFVLEGIDSSITLLHWLLPAWLGEHNPHATAMVLAGDINVFAHHLLSFLEWRRPTNRHVCEQVLAMYLHLRYRHAAQHGVHAVDEFYDQLSALEDSLLAHEGRAVSNNETSLLQVMRTFHVSINSVVHDVALMAHLDSIYQHRILKLCQLFTAHKVAHSLLVGLLAEHFIHFRRISSDKAAVQSVEKQLVLILVDGLTSEQVVAGTQLGWVLLLNALAPDLLRLLPASVMHAQREVYQALLRGVARLVLYFHPETHVLSEDIFLDCVANATLAIALSLFDVPLTSEALRHPQHSQCMEVEEGLQLLNDQFLQWILSQEHNVSQGVHLHFNLVLIVSKLLSHALRKTTVLLEACLERQWNMQEGSAKKIVKFNEGLVGMYHHLLTSCLPKLSSKDQATVDILGKVGASFTNVEADILQVLYASRNVSTNMDAMDVDEQALTTAGNTVLRDVGSKIVKAFNKHILTSSTMFVDVLLSSILHHKVGGIAGSQLHLFFAPLRQVLLIVNSVVTYAIRSHVPHITSNLAIFSELLEKLYKVLKLMQKHASNAQRLDESLDTDTMVRQGYQLLSRIFSNIANIMDLEKHMHLLLASFIHYLATYIQTKTNKSKHDLHHNKVAEETSIEESTVAMALEKEILFPGMFAIFEKLNLRQKTQMFKSMDAMSRAVMTDIHDDFMRTYKYQGN